MPTTGPYSPQFLFRPILRCISATALVFRAGKQRIPANQGLKRASPQTTVSQTGETVSKVPEKQVIGA